MLNPVVNGAADSSISTMHLMRASLRPPLPSPGGIVQCWGKVTNSAEVVDETDFDNTTVVSVFPNPSTGHFNINIETGNYKDKVSIRIMDITGRVLEVKRDITGSQTVRMGSNLRSGFYVAEIRQGELSAQVKLVKQ